MTGATTLNSARELCSTLVNTWRVNSLPASVSTVDKRYISKSRSLIRNVFTQYPDSRFAVEQNNP